MARRDQFERTHRLLRLVGRSEGESLPPLVHEPGVNRRTVYRAIEAFGRRGGPVLLADETLPKRWHVRPDYLRAASLLLGPDELRLLSIPHVHARDAQDGPLAEAVRRLVSKIRRALPKELPAGATALRSHLTRSPALHERQAGATAPMASGIQ